MQRITIIRGKKFQKEFEKLQKKYRSLPDDLDLALQFIQETPFGDDSKHWSILKQEKEKAILKKRMMCRAVRGSQFRLIYYYDGEVLKLECIEIYFKGNKENEDRKRIEEIWKEKTQ